MRAYLSSCRRELAGYFLSSRLRHAWRLPCFLMGFSFYVLM